MRQALPDLAETRNPDRLGALSHHMASKADLKEAAKRHMERRIIRIESLPDQAGIAAALRRAFTAGPPPAEDCDHLFEDLLKRLH
jgi:hypothetical protein